MVHVIAGCADDRITLLQLLHNRQFMTRATIADAGGTMLSNFSAIAALGRGEGLDIFVNSAAEHGLTRLRYDMGPAKQALVAVVQAQAGACDDILYGGSKVDTLTSGSGTDIVVLAPDEVCDTITNFQVGEDRIALAA